MIELNAAARLTATQEVVAAVPVLTAAAQAGLKEIRKWAKEWGYSVSGQDKISGGITLNRAKDKRFRLLVNKAGSITGLQDRYSPTILKPVAGKDTENSPGELDEKAQSKVIHDSIAYLKSKVKTA